MPEVPIFCVSDVSYMHCLETLPVDLVHVRFSVTRKHLEGFTHSSGPLPASPGPLIACILGIISKA